MDINLLVLFTTIGYVLLVHGASIEEKNIKTSMKLDEVYTTKGLDHITQTIPSTTWTSTGRSVSLRRITTPPLFPDDYDWGDSDTTTAIKSKVTGTTAKTLVQNHQTNEKDKDQSKKKVDSEFDDLTGDRIGGPCIASLVCGK